MRHKVKGRKFGRVKEPRELMLRNLATSLILHEKVRTTEAKAKEVRGLVEKVITAGKKKNLTASRYIEKILLDKKAVQKIVEVLAPKYEARPGGFVRLTKMGARKGDAAPVVLAELV